jgi:arylsulfatase A-like enzyme
VHIPLLIARPGQSQRQDIDTVTSCVDLLPTLLQVTGQPIPDWCEGIVLPAFSEAQVEDDRTVFMVEAKQNGQWAPLTVATVALRKGAYKLIHNFGYGVGEDAYELYDLAHDPEEFVNLVHEEPAMAASLQDEMNQRLQQANEPYQTSG